MKPVTDIKQNIKNIFAEKKDKAPPKGHIKSDLYGGQYVPGLYASGR